MEGRTNSHRTNGDALLGVLIAISITAGALLRVFLFPVRPNLWEDEIKATTHAVQPIADLLVNVFRHDIHPPLYFIQLHVWSLISHADAWFVCNSVFWSVVALASLFIVTKRLTGDVYLAAAAVGVLAILPTSLEDAFSVRMYSMLSTMVIWCYYFAHRAFFERSRRHYIWVTVTSLLIVYTHAIGFLAVLFNAIYALSQLLRRRAAFQDYGWWLLVYGGTAILAVPILASDLLHDANLPGIANLDTMLSWAATITIGFNAAGSALMVGVGVSLFLIASIGGFINWRTRTISISFITLPLLLAILATLAIKPIFKTNFFSAVESPFVAMVLASLVLDIPRRAFRAAGFAALAATLTTLGVYEVSLRAKSTNYPAAAALIRAQWQPGDAVYVPQLSMFWGIAWYLVGPDWGSPLKIAPMPNAKWQRVYQMLGPGLVKQLGLMPTSQKLSAGKFTLFVGDGSLVAAERGHRLWVLAYPRADLPKGTLSYTLASLHKVSTWRFGFKKHLVLALYAR